MIFDLFIVFLGTLLLLCLLPLFFAFRVAIFVLSFLRSAEIVRGKVILITGASSGIGEQMCYAYAKRGARLVIVARREKLLEKVAEKARRLGSPEVIHVCADVSKEDDCRRFVEEAVNHFGRLDHLVNNAGITSLCLLENATDMKRFEPIMDVNFWGSIFPTFFAIPHLRRTKGSILVNASSGATLCLPGVSVYSASKAALISFYDTMRVEFPPEISITVATLGFIDSEMTQGRHLSEEGSMEVTPLMQKVLANTLPVMDAGNCAEAMVKAVCRKDRLVTEPKWFKILILMKILCPELVDLVNRFGYYLKIKANAAKTTNSITCTCEINQISCVCVHP